MADLAARLARFRVPLGFLSGVLVLVLAHPRAGTLLAGLVVACIGEAVRVWAAGHLEKSREVTRSGPYRWARHPLYVGSSIMGLGVAVASASLWVASIALAYLGVTLTAAVRTEEAFLRTRFGDEYDAYCRGQAPSVERSFSWARVWRNREWRAMLGLAVAGALLAAKAAWMG
jgi:protein-S-isoprenylcysteine O-methyltransferase Ste14